MADAEVAENAEAKPIAEGAEAPRAAESHDAWAGGRRVAASVFFDPYAAIVVSFCDVLDVVANTTRESRRHSVCTVCGMITQTADRLNQITSTILSAAIDIHRTLGPGLFERAYLTCLTRDLVDTHLRIEVQKAIPLVYRNVRIECAYRADLVVEECVLVEVKAIDVFAPIHDQQVRTYLRLGHYPVGLLLNFSAPTMKAGIKRIVNNFPET